MNLIFAISPLNVTLLVFHFNKPSDLMMSRRSDKTRSTHAVAMMSLDAFERPPPDLVLIFKKYQKTPVHELAEDVEIENLGRSGLYAASASFDAEELLIGPEPDESPPPNGPADMRSLVLHASKSLPGLAVVPSMLSLLEQEWLLDQLLHRDLANDAHQTNLHKHYRIPYELCGEDASNSHVSGCSNSSHASSSFFRADSSIIETVFPLDATVHKPLTMHQVLHRKLRWITLGGQYDWTNKTYPRERPPSFPTDVKALVQRYFPKIVPEAAIVNIYSPGDTLSLHRDVSESSDQGLVSISIGCDALFVVGIWDADREASRCHVLHLRSGDAVYMSHAARYAWHGVPRIIPSTCPSDLRPWPAAANEEEGCTHFKAWRGWMATKRINLNVRQMYDRHD